MKASQCFPPRERVIPGHLGRILQEKGAAVLQGGLTVRDGVKLVPDLAAPARELMDDETALERAYES